MKKVIFFLLIVLMISNVVWSWFYFNKKDDKDDKPLNSVVRLYTLRGEGENWDITDYKIIVTPTKILRGHGKLSFKGDPSKVDNSTYYKFEAQENDVYGNYDAVFVNAASSKDGPVGLLINLDDMGSITSDYSSDEVKKDRQNYESTRVNVTWNDNEGEIHSETISLSIESEVTIE